MESVSEELIPFTAAPIDDVTASLLIGCIVLAIISTSVSRGFIARQAKTLIYTAHGAVTEVSETSAEMRAQGILLLTGGMSLSLMACIAATGTTPLTLAGEIAAMAVACPLVKAILYTWVNITFWDANRNKIFLKALLFITTTEGIALLIGAALMICFNMSLQNVTTYAIIVLVIAKIVTFLRAYNIFFTDKRSVFNFLLYFCTLEGAPTLALWASVGLVTDALTTK